jgi:PAS domain S-box-containing protein
MSPRSEKELREVINTVPANVWSTLPDGAIDFINQRWQDFTGLPPEKALGWNWEAVVHPDDRAAFRVAWRAALEKGRPMESEVRVRRADGEYRCLLVRNVPFRDELGKIVKWYGTGIDIEDRKRAEEGLRRSEKQLRDLIETIPAMAFAIGPDGSTEFVSRGWRDYAGLSAEASSSGGWQATVHPDDLDAHLAGWAASLANGEPFENEVRHRNTHGEYRWFLTRAAPLRDQQGNVRKWYGILTDIEDRKRADQALARSEAYLTEAQKLTHTGSWAWDARSSKVLYASEEMFRIFGLDPKESLPTRKNFRERIHPDDRDRVDARFLTSIRDRVDSFDEYRVLLPDGTLRYVNSLGHPVLDASGDLTGFIGTAVDVTEHKRAEEEHEKLRQLEADLAHLNRVTTMGVLAASLAHELTQPIAATIANAKACLRWLTRARPDLDEARAAVTRIAKDGTRAAEIIDRLRSFYKKGGPSRREPVDVNDIAREMLTLLRSEANRHSISLRMELALEVPKVMADRVQLQQVFMNLMVNGIEAMKETAGELTITSRLADDGRLLVSVSDTGVGLPAGTVEQMFDAFFTTKPQGTGMGLAISRSIIESHGGRLWATGNLGRGATFYFALPQETAARA